MYLANRILNYFLFGPHLNALVNGPLFSLEARGAVGKAIVYAKWKGRDYVRKYVVPANPRSLAQQFQRGILESLSHWWAYLGTTNKATWQTLANSHNYSTFNAYCKFNLDGETDGDNPIGNAASGGHSATVAVASVVITGGVNKIDVVATSGVSPNADDLLIVTLSTDGGANATAQTITRVMHGRSNLATSTAYEMDMLHVPAGSYRVGARTIGTNGTATAWVMSSGAVTVTGV